MKLSRNQIVAGIAYVTIPTCIFGYHGFLFALGAPVLPIVGYIVINALTEDGVNLGKPGRSIFASSKPSNYNKYRRGYRNRK